MHREHIEFIVTRFSQSSLFLNLFPENLLALSFEMWRPQLRPTEPIERWFIASFISTVVQQTRHGITRHRPLIKMLVTRTFSKRTLKSIMLNYISGVLNLNQTVGRWTTRAAEPRLG